MADLSSILTDPNYVNANAATKAAIFDKYAPLDSNFANANEATQMAIRQKFGLEMPSVEPSSTEGMPTGREESTYEKVKKYAAPVAEAGGAILGGIAGTALGPAGTVAGAGLGYGAVKELENLADVYIGGKKPREGAAVITEPVKNVIEGATMEAGGRAAAPVIGAAAKKGGQILGGVYNALSPKSAAYLEGAEGLGPQIVNALRGKLDIVPGSMPTAAEAASSVGSAKFSAMGAAAERLKPTESVALRDAQKAAQLAAVRTVGGTKAELKAAEAVRKATAEKLYGISDEALLPGRERQFEAVQTGKTAPGVLREAETGAPVMVEVGRNPLTNEPIMQAAGTTGGVPIYKQVLAGYKYDKDLAKMMERPAIQSAFDSAALIAENRGVSLFNKDGQLTGEGAHLVKLALDDAATPIAGQTALGANATNALNSAKSTYLKWVEDTIPAYKTARETFAAQSKPINQMEVGQFLEGKLTPALGEETAKLRAGQFATAIDQAPQTIKKATGQPRFEQLEDVLTPDQMKVINDVRADLERQSRTELLAKAGRGSVDLERVASAAQEGARAPHIMSRIITTANDLITRLQGKLDRKLAIEIATEMLDPKLAAQALEKAMARQAKGAAMAEPFKKAGRGAANLYQIPGAATGVINALSPNQNQNALVQ